MLVTKATAPGKVILFGEHAVVYGRPAIAAPLLDVRALAVVETADRPGIWLRAPDLNREYWFAAENKNDPLTRAVHLALDAVNGDELPNLNITVSSSIPIASGLGSGAAMAAAVIRAIYCHLVGGAQPPDELVSALTFQVERILHGSPSGIDNSVVALEMPIYFIRRSAGNLIEALTVGAPIHLLVADTGVVSITRLIVEDVRRKWEAEPAQFEALFDNCGQTSESARRAIERGEISLMGKLMSRNQALLRQMTVSSVELEKLISAAEEAGAIGAKLSGAGRGGNMICLVPQEKVDSIRDALLSAGAVTVLESVIG